MIINWLLSFISTEISWISHLFSGHKIRGLHSFLCWVRFAKTGNRQRPIVGVELALILIFEVGDQRPFAKLMKYHWCHDTVEQRSILDSSPPRMTVATGYRISLPAADASSVSGIRANEPADRTHGARSSAEVNDQK